MQRTVDEVKSHLEKSFAGVVFQAKQDLSFLNGAMKKDEYFRIARVEIPYKSGEAAVEPAEPFVAVLLVDGRCVELAVGNMELAEKLENFEVDIYHPASKKEIKVGDTVMFIADARLWRGVVIKANAKTYKISWSSYNGKTEVKNIVKEKVAYQFDTCTVVCDYAKDPNGMSVRFEYSDDFIFEHRAAHNWGHQPSGFYSLN